MRINLLTIGISLAVSGAVVLSAPAAGLVALNGHVPAMVSQLQPLGNLAAATNLNLAIGLPLRNREALTNLLREIYDPASPNYRHYLTPEEFTAQFGPTEQDYQAVINFAKANGLTVIGTHPNRVVLDVSGKVGQIENAFHVSFHTYQHPKEARKFFAPDTNPTVDSSLPILRVSGMDNYSIPHPNYKIRPLDQTAGVTPNTGSGPGGAYQGNDFRANYVPGTTLTGAGQNVGLLQFDGFFSSDITAYENQIGLTGNVPQLVIVPVDGGVPSPNPLSGGVGEVSLDIEMVVSMAPGVSKIYVYEAPNPSPWVDLLSRMANDNLAKQLSCSWGGGPPDPVAEQIFQQMAIQGQTFFTASGDSDAFNAVSNPIEFPSDSPHITEVGGTFLTTGPSVNYVSETVWNRDVQVGPVWDGVGSSGGISTYYSIPTWQTNVNFAVCQGSPTMRNVPDVALTAENVWVIYSGGQAGAFGGTSCAAPLWAGFTALINQQATNSALPPVGFLNPALYAIARGANYTNCFHDITTGNNEWSGNPNLFSAVAGYDLCTGLGTPNGVNLINALVSAGTSNTFTHISAPLPPYGTTLSALNGGNPNGNWELFIQGNMSFNSGMISNGWILSLTTASPVGAVCDLALTMTVSPVTNVLVGGTLVYVIGVTNYGVSTATNVVVSDALPTGVSVVSTSTTQGSINRNGFNVIWKAGDLPSGVGAQLTLTAEPNSSGILVNQAVASTDTPDPNSDDDFRTVTVNVGTAQPPQFGTTRMLNGQFVLSITSPTASTIVQTSTNLAKPSWVNVFTSTPPFTFTNNATNPARFYRALLGP